MDNKKHFRYLIALGSNQGFPEENLQWALEQIKLWENARIITASGIINTCALKTHEQTENNSVHPDYANQIIDLSTNDRPLELYNKIRILEDFLGHPRDKKWSNRHLDIDILLWAQNLHKSFTLCSPLKYSNAKENMFIPHLELQNRPFLLETIRELKYEIS